MQLELLGRRAKELNRGKEKNHLRDSAMNMISGISNLFMHSHLVTFNSVT